MDKRMTVDWVNEAFLSAVWQRKPRKGLIWHTDRGSQYASNSHQQYRYLNGHYILSLDGAGPILSLDGAGPFSSEKINCKQCCSKKHRNGKTSDYPHLLGAARVHPDHKVVIPLAPEPIIKGDGENKNDCERNAAKRWLADFRREHPHLKTRVVEDGLGSNFPHLALLDSLTMSYIPVAIKI